MVSNLALILGKSFQGSESPGEASVGQEAGTKPGALTLWHVLGENTCGLVAALSLVLSLVFVVSGWGSAGWGDGSEEVGRGVGGGKVPRGSQSGLHKGCLCCCCLSETSE